MPLDLRRIILGSYDWSSRPVVYFPGASGRVVSLCTEQHEHSHWQLANSSTFGYFQMVVAALRSIHAHQDRSSVFEKILKKTVNASWNVHESYATFDELNVLRLAAKQDEMNWRKCLPRRYAKALELCEVALVSVRFPSNLKSGIAYCIADLALNCSILTHFANSFEPSVEEVSAYLSDPTNNPNQRYLELVRAISSQSTEFENYLKREVLNPVAQQFQLEPDYFLRVEFPDDGLIGELEAVMDWKLRLYFLGRLPQIHIVPLEARDKERLDFRVLWHDYYKNQGIELDVDFPLVCVGQETSPEEFESLRKQFHMFRSDIRPEPGRKFAAQQIDDVKEFVTSNSGQTFCCALFPIGFVGDEFVEPLGFRLYNLPTEQLKAACESNGTCYVYSLLHGIRSYKEGQPIFEEEASFLVFPLKALKHFVYVTSALVTLYVVQDLFVDLSKKEALGIPIAEFRGSLYVVPLNTSTGGLVYYLRQMNSEKLTLKLYSWQIGTQTEALRFLVGKTVGKTELNVIAPMTEMTYLQMQGEVEDLPGVIPCKCLEEYETDEKKNLHSIVVAEHIRQYGC